MSDSTLKIPTPEEVAAAKAAVEALEAEHTSLDLEERTIRARLKAIDERQRQIKDWRGIGELPRARERLAHTQRLVHDSTAPIVRVSMGRGADPDDPAQWRVCVIDTNGTKRAVLRKQYSPRDTYQFPSVHYTVHPADQHLLKLYGAAR